MQKMPGIVELQMGKNFTPEEEDKEIMAFKQLENDFGYYNIYTIRVVPEDGRPPPYHVHIDNAERK